MTSSSSRPGTTRGGSDRLARTARRADTSSAVDSCTVDYGAACDFCGYELDTRDHLWTVDGWSSSGCSLEHARRAAAGSVAT